MELYFAFCPGFAFQINIITMKTESGNHPFIPVCSTGYLRCLALPFTSCFFLENTLPN